MEACLLLTVVAAAVAVPQYDAHISSDVYDPYDPPKYEFEYSVQDHATVNDYGQREARDGASTAGSYEVRLPDTRLQRVRYSVDGDSGFIADVQFDGQARHPDQYNGASTAGGRSYVQSRHPDQYNGGATAGGRSYVQSQPPRGHSQPSTQGYASAEPKTSYGPAPSQPKTGYRPAPSQPKTGYRPAPSQPKTRYRTALSQPKTSYGPAPSQPNTSYGPAPSQPNTSYRTAPSQPETSYSPAQSQPEIRYSPEAETTSPSEPSVYGNKKLKFARVPSDIYDKPLFRADYERAVHSRGGGSRRKSQAAPARYGPRSVLISSDDDRYIVPDTPEVPGLQKLLSAPWVSYQKALESYLAKEKEQENRDDVGKVTYGGGREEAHGDTQESFEAPGESQDSSGSSSAPFGTRISPRQSRGEDEYPSYTTIQ